MKARFFCSIILITLSSCRTYLTPAILGNNIAYIPKAMVVDSVKTLRSISASYAGASDPNSKVSFELGMLNISQSHTFKSFNLSYGIFGYTGKASSKTYTDDIEYKDDYITTFNKSFSGAGLRISTGLHSISSNQNTDFRYLNFENAFSFEDGDYEDFRQEIYNGKIPKYVAVSNKNMIWTTGLSTEIIWRGRKNKDVKNAFKLYVGGTRNLSNSFRYGEYFKKYNIHSPSSLGYMISYFLYIKKFNLTLEAGKNTNWAAKTSLGYSF